jgi:ABC-type transport system involved in cytochrome c biogenesis ATPase subunit
MPTQRLIDDQFPALTTLGVLRIPSGLTAVIGDEGTGKTRLLRQLVSDASVDGLWLDLALPEHDDATPEEVWQTLQVRCPNWNDALQMDLMQALDLQGHLDKKLFMLSTGSRRKVALVALLASGATLTCLDQPYAALDMASMRIIREFLQDMAEHPSRAWIVADYEADSELPWNSVIALP